MVRDQLEANTIVILISNSGYFRLGEWQLSYRQKR